MKIGYRTKDEYMKALTSGTISQDEITLIKDDYSLTSLGSSNSANININYEDIFKYISKRFNQVPTVEHKCHNCGGTLEINPNEGIFKCPYCRSVYAIGTQRVNDRG